MLTVKEARIILQEEADAMSDDDLLLLLRMFHGLARLAIEDYKAEKGRKELLSGVNFRNMNPDTILP